ncbi:hypothetical protein, partial [Moraxella lacunata]|uniref:hypothetical protein n=1 Tax=Moraxella lacunata TaxID=477 RepID=UPI001D0D12BC
FHFVECTMKEAIKFDHCMLINNSTVNNKLCLHGIPIADYDLAGIERIFIHNKWFDILDLKTSVAIWGGVNIHYLIDYDKEIANLSGGIGYIDDDKFYQSLNEKATTDNLTYFKR